jgi:hypothetical protein
MLIFLLLKKRRIIPNLLTYIDKHMETFNNVKDKSGSSSNLYMNLFEDIIVKIPFEEYLSEDPTKFKPYLILTT